MLEHVKGAKEYIIRMEKSRGGGEHPIVKEKLPTEKEIGGKIVVRLVENNLRLVELETGREVLGPYSSKWGGT